MDFSDFANRLSDVIRNGNNASVFTKTIIGSILNEEGQDILDSYSLSSFKSYYNGNTKISRLAQKVNAYIETDGFSEYILNFPEDVLQNLCDRFLDVLPEINLHTVGYKLADLFVSILLDAASSNKNSASKGAGLNDLREDYTVIRDEDLVKLPSSYDGHMISGDGEEDPFNLYLEKAVDFLSIKKTILNLERPRDFYDIYVCNDLVHHKWHMLGFGGLDSKPEITISDGTVKQLEDESRYIVIEGTGGIGKSMYLTHLFLSSAAEYDKTGELPVFISLKDYRENISGIVEFIWLSLKTYDPDITQRQVINELEDKRLILLMDGLDEIQTSLRDAFDMDLEAFIKSYPGNMTVITSRPINSFVSYTKFTLFDLKPLTKGQAIELIQKLEFWDEISKQDFIKALDRKLYNTHMQFASNPLLLTIMLMTYSSFGEIPAKMHVFYSKAYETMARLHDQTKGSFKRPLNTKLTPEEFVQYFSQFCARTYRDEVLDFDERTFSSYMEKVLKGTSAKEEGIKPRDFLLDLTNNLCIMYKEGDGYYFIHRSFQEYFAAVYFASMYDVKLKKVGDFFEKQLHRSYTDRTFDMLYDMKPRNVERYIFLPFLEELFEFCEQAGEADEYWAFLEKQYPILYHEEGRTGADYPNEPKSFLYQKIITEKKLKSENDIDFEVWPSQVLDLPRKNWVNVYTAFMEEDAYDRNPDPENIDDEDLQDKDIVGEDEVYFRYSDYFGEPEVEGFTIEIDIYELRRKPEYYSAIRDFMETADFPLVEEYHNVKKYYTELKERAAKEDESDNLFDD